MLLQYDDDFVPTHGLDQGIQLYQLDSNSHLSLSSSQSII